VENTYRLTGSGVCAGSQIEVQEIREVYSILQDGASTIGDVDSHQHSVELSFDRVGCDDGQHL